MKKEKFEEVSGGRRRSSDWQKDIGQFLNGFIHGWIVLPNNKKESK